MIKITLTSVTGNTHDVYLDRASDVADYVDRLSSNLPKGVTLKVDAPIAGVSGWVRAKA